ncbi:MAG: hypothetical protein OEZ39_18175 [Gammaproteobacteria bacterium]|nr:hypothetical protein [Gammaproteobacteria bacterium]MDH5653794.1 hypothetical protein [Gammaproteobacteria bacterium]
MVNRSPGCFGNYDFDHIAYYARRRFVDGCNTITLLSEAKTDTEREEIALVCMLDVEDELVLDIELECRYATDCKVTNCRDKLRKLIEKELGFQYRQAN